MDETAAEWVSAATMGEDDQPDTLAAGHDPETTVVDTDTAAAPELAWALADDTDEPVTHRGWSSAWGIVAVIIACSIVIAGVTGVVLWVSRQRSNLPPPPVEAKPITTVAQSNTPPIPVTVTAAPPAPVVVPTTTAVPTLQGADARFVTFLRGSGPIGFNAISTAEAIADAHLVCTDLQQDSGFQNINDKLQNLSPNDIIWFVNIVPGFYCPQFHND